jgi:hypothetical protein
MPTLKRKEPPPLQEQQPSVAPPRDIPGQALNEDRIVRINPEVDARLTAFMQGNSKATEYYTKLVKENPSHAVRTIMLPKMFRFEAEQRMSARMAPQAREWFEQQGPEVRQKIMDRIQRVSPYYRETASVRIVAEEKAKLEFKPKEAVGQGVSIG